MKLAAFPHRQGGYSLIELMVAGTLGLFLMTGIINIYLSGLQTTNLQGALSDLQDRGRFVSQYLVDDIQKAGWADPLDNSQAAITSGIRFGAGQTQNNSSECVTGSGINCDTLQIRYYGITDCLGAQVNLGATGLVTNTYAVVNGDLQCTGFAGAPATLISGVESFQLLYGVDDRDSGGATYNGLDSQFDGIIDRYLAAADVPTDTARRNILAVRYAVLLRSTSDTTLDSAVSRNYTLLNEAQQTFNDRYLRVLFSGTISVRNN